MTMLDHDLVEMIHQFSFTKSESELLKSISQIEGELVRELEQENQLELEGGTIQELKEELEKDMASRLKAEEQRVLDVMLKELKENGDDSFHIQDGGLKELTHQLTERTAHLEAETAKLKEKEKKLTASYSQLQKRLDSGDSPKLFNIDSLLEEGVHGMTGLDLKSYQNLLRLKLYIRLTGILWDDSGDGNDYFITDSRCLSEETDQAKEPAAKKLKTVDGGEIEQPGTRVMQFRFKNTEDIWDKIRAFRLPLTSAKLIQQQ